MERIFALLIPFFGIVIWLGIVVYMLFLATRLVNAVEQIARAVAQHPPGRLQP